jgi:cobalt-zinc-cadmium efflux system outer membrane protein
MIRSRKWLPAALVGLSAGPALADPCHGPYDPGTAVVCAVGHSPEVRAAQAGLAALSGRRVAAGVWLPSNPLVAGTVARRQGGEEGHAPVLNWTATLSQELEIGGQRGARLELADAEAAAQIRRLAVAEQEVAAQALDAWLEAAAAAEGLRLAEELVETGRLLASAAEARAREALLSGVDADLARAEGVRLGVLRLEAGRRSELARVALGLATGGESAADTTGPLAVPPWLAAVSDQASDAEALRLRGDIAAATMERQVLERQVSLLRRERIPNLTMSGFLQQDGFHEQVAGVGLSVPLPLPAPLGRTRAGEIAEAMARARGAEASLAQVRRRVLLEVAAARAGLRARREAVALYPAPLLSRARADLAALRLAMTARQLPLREGLLAQRPLIELLQGHIEARLAHAQATVELRRATGRSLLPGGQ